jgi:hypothetical protein
MIKAIAIRVGLRSLKMKSSVQYNDTVVELGTYFIHKPVLITQVPPAEPAGTLLLRHSEPA